MPEYIRSHIEFCAVAFTNTDFLFGSVIDDTQQGPRHKPVGSTLQR